MDQQLPTAPRVNPALALKDSNMKRFCVTEKQHWILQGAKLSCDTRPKVFCEGSISKASSDKWCKGHCKVPHAQEMSHLSPQETCALLPSPPNLTPHLCKSITKNDAWKLFFNPPLIKILWRAAKHLRRNDLFRCLMKICICLTKKKKKNEQKPTEFFLQESQKHLKA